MLNELMNIYTVDHFGFCFGNHHYPSVSHEQANLKEDKEWSECPVLLKLTGLSFSEFKTDFRSESPGSINKTKNRLNF